MQRYIGMDVHAKSCSFGIIDQKNKKSRPSGSRDQRSGADRVHQNDTGPEANTGTVLVN
jgi:hypothetical protein